MSLPVGRILDKLDEHLHRNDYDSARQRLLYWLAEAQSAGDTPAAVAVGNELMGLYRKLGQREQAVEMAEATLRLVRPDTVTAATTYLNAATVYKAFSAADKALPLYEQAQCIYERELAPSDTRLAGLYNNMALALVDLGRYETAEELYHKALAIVTAHPDGAPEAAITHLNLASAAESRLGLEEGEAVIAHHLEQAQSLLEGYEKWDGNYAFVCEKCASVFGYYGHFAYQIELENRARRIYEGS